MKIANSNKQPHHVSSVNNSFISGLNNNQNIKKRSTNLKKPNTEMGNIPLSARVNYSVQVDDNKMVKNTYNRVKSVNRKANNASSNNMIGGVNMIYQSPIRQMGGQPGPAAKKVKDYTDQQINLPRHR